MERNITQQIGSADATRVISYEKAAEHEKATQKQEVLSCNQLLRNLLKTNLKLIKINDINTFLMF